MSDALTRGIARLKMRLPDRRAAIDLGVNQAPIMTELLEAYEAAWQAAEFWRVSVAPIAPARAAEYLQLASDVEKDILDTLP